jgi:hypothetical protein
MTEESSPAALLFARLLCDVMIPAEISMAIRVHGYEVVEARTLPVEIQQDDRAILTEATRQQCVVLTCNYSAPRATFVCSIQRVARRAGSTAVSSSCRNISSVIAWDAGRCAPVSSAF